MPSETAGRQLPDVLWKGASLPNNTSNYYYIILLLLAQSTVVKFDILLTVYHYESQ
jgi:hypothetical protein